MFGTSPDDSRDSNGNGLLTPIHATSRKASGGHGGINGESSPNYHNTSSSPLTDGGQWSSAVGHATTGGKSGRVIEKLMADNDRLKRELKEQVVKAEEMQKSLETFKPRLETLQVDNSNLSHARGVDAALLSRRERIINDLKEELKQEKESRKAYQTMSQKLSDERDEAVQEKNREVQLCTEKLQHAQAQNDVLQMTYKQQRELFTGKSDTIRGDILRLQKEKEEDRQRLAKLDVVSNQMRREVERTQTLQEQLVKKWEELGIEKKQQFSKLEEEARAETERSKQLSTEMDAVVKEMKWLMAVKKNTRLDEKGA